MAGDPQERDLDAEADEALEAARLMPSGQAKVDALNGRACCARLPMLRVFHLRNVAGRASEGCGSENRCRIEQVG